MRFLIFLSITISLISCSKTASEEGVSGINSFENGFITSSTENLRVALISRLQSLSLIRPGQKFIKRVSGHEYYIENEKCIGTSTSYGRAWSYFGNNINVKLNTNIKPLRNVNPDICYEAGNLSFKEDLDWNRRFDRRDADIYIDNLISMDIKRVEFQPSTGKFKVFHNDPYTSEGSLLINPSIHHSFMEEERVETVNWGRTDQVKVQKRTTYELVNQNWLTGEFNGLEQ